jgi:hypothetical protein
MCQPFTRCHIWKQGWAALVSRLGRRYLRAGGQVYGSSAAYLNAGRRMAAVTGTSRGADAARLYRLDAQHDPWRASAFAWRTGCDDNGLLGALEPRREEWPGAERATIKRRAKPSPRP